MAKLYKRGGVYWCRVRNQHGRIIRRSTKCADREAAAHVAAEYERAGSSPAYRAAASTTLAAAVDRMIADRKAKGRAAATIRMYVNSGRHLLAGLGADTPLSRIDAEAVDRYLAARRATGAAPYTVHLEKVTLGATLSLAIRHGYFDRQLGQVMPVRMPTGYTPGKRWLTSAEVDALLAGLPPARARHVAWMVATGSTLGESTRAQVEDVGAAEVRIRGTKTAARARVVPLVPIFADLFRRAMVDAPSSGKIFAPWPDAARLIAKTLRRAGYEGATAHDLRRTSATWLLHAGVAPSTIGKFLGHTTSAMVDRVYGKMTTEALGRLIAGSFLAQSAAEPAKSSEKTGEIKFTSSSHRPTRSARDLRGFKRSALPGLPGVTADAGGRRYKIGTPQAPWLDHPAWLADLQSREEHRGRLGGAA